MQNYGEYVTYQSAIAVAAIIMVAGFPNLVVRIKNQSGATISDTQIRLQIYTTQLIVVVSFFFILNTLHSFSEANTKIILVSILSACCFAALRIEKSIQVASGRGLASQVPELVLFPVAFGFLLIFCAAENLIHIDILTVRLWALFAAVLVATGLAFAYSRLTPNNDHQNSSPIQTTHFSQDWVLILVPILGIHTFFEVITIMAAYGLGKDIAANFDIARRFATIPYMVAASFMTPILRDIRLNFLHAKRGDNGNEQERSLSFSVKYLGVATFLASVGSGVGARYQSLMHNPTIR